MVEELKLAIKVDDDAIEQSLLKQFANAEKMANKVVLTFNNIDLDDKAIEAKFKEMQKMAGKNPIDLSIDKSSIEMLSAISKQLGNIFDIAKGKSIIDSSATVSEINKVTNAVNDLNSSLNKPDISSLQQEEKQIQKNIDSLKKLLDLKYEIKNVNKSFYSGKGNVDWIGIYKSQEEAISSDLSDRKEKLHSSLNLILSEDKNALISLEEEANRLKTSLQSVQDMSNRISSNSSISYLDKNKGSEEWYKGYAEAYKAIDDRLKELNNQYKLTNDELEEYITLQVKAEKIMDRMISHSGGVQGSGAKNKSELKSWIEKSFATDLGLNPEDIYSGLFGSITDALYDGNGISLFDSEGTKRSLREISAEILNYKSILSGISGAFGVNEDAEKLREFNSILNYIKNNASDIESTDFSSQIKKATELVDYYSKKLSEGEHTDFYSKSLKEAQDDLQNLLSLQERLDRTKVKQNNEIISEQQSSSVVEQQTKIQEKLKETQKQAEQTREAISNVADGNKSNISFGTQLEDVFKGDKIDQATTSAKELDKTLEQVDIPTDSFDDVLSKLDLTESKLKEIVKITKQSVSDSEGKFHDSYTLKDKRGSTEIYGLSSNTEKGQLLRSNIVGYDAKEIEQEAKAVQKLAEEKRKLRQQEKQSTQSSVDKALKDQVSAWKQIQSIREKIAKSNDANEIENLKKVKKEYQQSYIEADKILKTNSDIYDKEAQIARLEQVRLETNKKIADYKNPDISSMESSLARFEESSEKLSLKPDNEHSFESWKLKIDELNNAINEYRNKIIELQNKDGIIDKEDISEATELENRIKSLLREMQKTSSGDKGFEDISATKIAEQIHKLLEDNTAMSRKAKAEIQAYYDEVASGNPSRPLKEIYNDALKVVQAERAMGREGKSFLDTMKDKAWYGWAAQITSMFGVYDIINIFKQGANTLKEFDDGLTKISYTMDMTKSQLDNLGNSVLDMASNMKSSIDDAMQVAQIYANMQTSAEEIQRLSEPTLILSNLSGFDSSTIADDIQAVTQQFDILAEDSMHIADVYDYISRNIAVDYSKGLNAMAEGLQVAGSTAKQAGLSYEQTASIIAKAVEKTRLEGSQVGNGLKTIMTRLSKVGELSEEVDNETISQASESLKKVGIEVYNLDGSYREFDVIMGELAGKWDNLTDAEKSNISFNIAATRQTNLLSAVLSNFSDSMQLAEEATNANGSALENQQKYMESFSGHLQSLETEAKIAWLNILDSETLKDGVDLLTGLVKVVGQLVDTFGLLGTAAGIGGIVASFKGAGRVKIAYPHLYTYACRNKTLYA